MKLHNILPNLLTQMNLFCGFLGLLSCFYGELAMAASLVFIGAIFDLLDGWVARRLGSVGSAIGAQLDSLADMVTFVVLPGIIAHKMMVQSGADWLFSLFVGPVPVLTLIPFLFVAAGAYRLARFNVFASEKLSFFIGLPTPAAGLTLASFPLMTTYDPFVLYFNKMQMVNIVYMPWLIPLLSIALAYLMISKLILMSPKSKHKGWLVLIIISIALLAVGLFVAVPIILLCYLILSRLSRPQI